MSLPAPPTSPTHRGRVITDQEIQRLADEAGYDPARLRRVPGRPTRGTTASDVVRTALRSWLTSA